MKRNHDYKEKPSLMAQIYKNWWVRNHSWKEFATMSAMVAAAWILVIAHQDGLTDEPPPLRNITYIEGQVTHAEIKQWEHLFFNLSAREEVFYYPPVAGEVSKVAEALKPGATVRIGIDATDLHIAQNSDPKHYVTVMSVERDHKSIRSYEDSLASWNQDNWMLSWVVLPVFHCLIGLVLLGFIATTSIEYRASRRK